jgi:hypothetical protein
MPKYGIEIEDTPYGLYLTATIGGTSYKSRYKHKNTREALEDFRALIIKYEPKQDGEEFWEITK